MCRNIHKILTSLNTACQTHAKGKNGIYPPKVNIEQQSVDQMKIEITKLLNYIKHPQYSYLNK